jgi:hypothetical protein
MFQNQYCRPSGQHILLYGDDDIMYQEIAIFETGWQD